MASILDSGIASVFTSILIFLLIYALVFGLLTWRKWFGPHGGPWYAIIAFVVALFAAVAPPVKQMVIFVTPWYIALFLVVFFILFIVSIFGLSPDTDFPGIIRQPRVYSWIIIFAVIIGMLGLAFTFGPLLTPGGQAPPQQPVNTQGYDVIGGNSIPLAEPGALAPVPYAVPGQQQGVGPGQPGSTSTSNFGLNLLNTLFHPKIIGLIATFVIAALTVMFLSMPSH